jgi:hypothetical protein
MTNAFGLAAVTAVLCDLLDNGLVDHSVPSAVGSPVKVSAMPPDRIETGASEAAQLNVYLYRIAVNPALANAAQPARDARGDRLRDDPLALDLDYVVSAYAAKDLDADVLLGFAALTLHQNPILDRAAIRRALESPSPIDGSVLPASHAGLDPADLARQVERVRLTPLNLSVEELSKVWTAFQSKHRPSIALRASVVLLEAGRPARSPMPVLSRGERDGSGREAGPAVHASIVPPFPALEAAQPDSGQPAGRMGDEVALSGRHLAGTAQSARFVHVASGAALALPALGPGNASGFAIRLPRDPPGAPAPAGDLHPDEWRAGLYALSAVVRDGAAPQRESNAIGFAVAPAVTLVAARDGGDAVLTATCRPKVWRGQQVALLLGDRAIEPQPMAAAKNRTVRFRVPGLPAGSYWFRLRVDGVESLLVDRAADPPAYDPSQKVEVPP